MPQSLRTCIDLLARHEESYVALPVPKAAREPVSFDDPGFRPSQSFDDDVLADLLRKVQKAKGIIETAPLRKRRLPQMWRHMRGHLLERLFRNTRKVVVYLA